MFTKLFVGAAFCRPRFVSASLFAGMMLVMLAGPAAVNASVPPGGWLTVNTVGNGTVIANPPIPTDGRYNVDGTKVTLTANHLSGWTFGGWMVSSYGSNKPEMCQSSSPCIIDIWGDQRWEVTAMFIPNDGNFGGNYIKDGDFPDGSVGWEGLDENGDYFGENTSASWRVETWNNCKATASVGDGKVTIDPIVAGDDRWDPQLNQRGIPLFAGKTYRLSFTASSIGEPREMVASVQRGGPDVPTVYDTEDPYAPYEDKVVSLTTSPKKYSFDFDMLPSDDMHARITFQLGGFDVGVVISDVSLSIVKKDDGSNIVSGGSFTDESVAENWDFGASAAATGRVTENGEYAFEISAAGSAPGDVSLKQENIPVELNGKYALSFNARSDAPRTVVVVAEIDGWTEEWTFNLTTEPKTFDKAFTVSVPPALAKRAASASGALNMTLSFNSGHEAVNWYLSDVSLVEGSGNTSLSPRTAALRSVGAARVTVRNRTLHVRGTSSEAVSRVRLIDVRGRSVASFTTKGAGTFSLAKIPAGRYFVELREGAKRERGSVVVGVR